MEIKETCGFLDLDGGFHKTEKEAENANIKIKISNLEDTFNNLEDKVTTKLYEEYHYYLQQCNGDNKHDLARFEFLKREMFRTVARYLLQDSSDYLNVLKQKDSLKKELDELRKIQKYENKWWVKYKWW